MKGVKTFDFLAGEVRDYCSEAGFEKAVVGLSGGIDSVLTLKIAVKALGAKNVTALLMPEKGLSKQEHIDDAVEFAEQSGVEFHKIKINELLKELENSVPFELHEFALAQAKPRIRMALLYAYANNYGALVIGTSNKSEIMLGYYTKYGDGGTDLTPLSDLFKTEVFELAKQAGILKKFIEKKPSAELLEGQEDEKDFGFSYKEIDSVLKEIEKGKEFHELQKKFDVKLLARVEELVKNGKHKTGPKGIKIPKEMR